MRAQTQNQVTSFRVSRDTAKRVGRIQELVIRFGWAALGQNRKDSPTIDAVLSAAITLAETAAKDLAGLKRSQP